jgi:fatty-acid desaturase
MIFSDIAFILTLMGIYGTTVGSHRLWTHKTFKANGFLRFLLMVSQTMAGQVILKIQHSNKV